MEEGTRNKEQGIRAERKQEARSRVLGPADALELSFRGH
jgi:hypothetical protein